MSNSTNHQSIQELIPWYLSGTLEIEEHDLVEKHVRECVTCRRELNTEERFRTLINTTSTDDLSADVGFSRLSESLDVGKRRRQPYRAMATPHFALAAGVTMTLAALLFFGLFADRTDPAPEYVTLSITGGDAAFVDVVFGDLVTETEMRALLSDIEANIVAGPSEIGRYTIELMNPPANDGEYEELVRRMNSDSRVEFAGPTTDPVRPE